MLKSRFLLPLLVAALVILRFSVYIVEEREKVLVLLFGGQVVAERNDPGLYLKLPFVQSIVRYDDRILSLDTQPLEVTPLDDRRLVVDAFGRWQIADTVKFRLAVGTGGIVSAETRLGQILNAATREILGSVTSGDILSEDRAALMDRITAVARADAETLGVTIVDVRLKRTDLPVQNLNATFDRMRAEREREAADEIARGEEAALKVRAQADRTKVELVSEAQKNADIIRGEADAERNAIFAEAFGRDPEFFAFYRSLSAYENGLKGSNTTMAITPNSEFFDYLKSDTGVPAE